MSGEGALSKRLTTRMTMVESWHRVENSVGAGTPDVWYGMHGMGGWIELKQIHNYPKRIATPLKFKRYTVEQVGTIEQFGRSCGRSWVLVQVGADHYLFNWDRARDLWHGRPRPWWEANCRGMWKNRLNYEQLAKILYFG